MTCGDLRLEDRLLGFLDAGEAAGVDRHLESCAACRAERDRIQQLLDRLEELPASETGADAAPVVASVLASIRPKPRIAWEGRLMVAAASVLLCVVAWFTVFQEPIPAKQDPAPRAKEINKLVENLGNADVAERDKAEKGLTDLAKDMAHALAALDKARKSPDAEVASRAERAAKALRQALAALASSPSDAPETAAKRLEEINKRLVVNPADSSAFLDRGTLNVELKKWQEAIADFTRAIEIDPRCIEGYVARGRAREQLNDNAGALEDYNRARMLEEQKAQEKNPK